MIPIYRENEESQGSVLESFKAITISLYFHVIGFLAMQWSRLNSINFDVYKDKPAPTK